jgi:hypothetical protein
MASPRVVDGVLRKLERLVSFLKAVETTRLFIVKHQYGVVILFWWLW